MLAAPARTPTTAEEALSTCGSLVFDGVVATLVTGVLTSNDPGTPGPFVLLVRWLPPVALAILTVSASVLCARCRRTAAPAPAP